MIDDELVGVEHRKIISYGNWSDVSNSVRATKEAIKCTSDGTNDLENLAIRTYYVAYPGDSFADYKNRVARSLADKGEKRELKSLFSENKIPFTIYLVKEDDYILRINSITEEKVYSVIISANGKHINRAAGISTEIKKILKHSSIWYTYTVSDRL